MKINLQEVTVRELTKDYVNDDENGVYAMEGILAIRPPYQREFIYNDKQRNAVIETVRNGFPLNVLYFVKAGSSFEVLDGQQRSMSICEYVVGNFSMDYLYFHNLTEEEQNKILDYKLMVYFCEGTDKEKLNWFKTINISGVKLSNQELRNAIYTGTWLSDAKKYFSKTGGIAYSIGSNLLKGSPNRQDYLETALKWISNNEIEDFMSVKQHNPNANKLKMYFSSVIDWVNTIFPNYRKKEMKGLDWGFFYNEFKEVALDSDALEERIQILMQDDSITNKKGIYEYLLTGNEKHLNIRAFTDSQRREVYEIQNGVCPKCEVANNSYKIEEMHADHKVPWSKGGKTEISNCQMLCREHNLEKSNK